MIRRTLWPRRLPVARLHNQEAAEKAASEFDAVFAKGQIPSETPEILLESKMASIVQVIVDNKLAPSLSEARRLISQGAVTIDGDKVENIHSHFKASGDFLLKVGKRRFLKVKVKA